MSATGEPFPDWEAVLSAAARLQQIVPEAVLVGGTAAAIHADHRLSRDADHVLARISHQPLNAISKLFTNLMVTVVAMGSCDDRLRWPRPRRSFGPVRARATSTVVPAMLSVASTRTEPKSSAIIAATGEKSGLVDLRSRFEEVLAQLESVAGWRTARVRPPVLILGNLDGIETGVRQLIREEPLETTTLDVRGVPLTIPTEAEILRIKGVLILKRNATRDYLDFAALADRLGDEASCQALGPFDRIYRQDNDESPLQQLQAQLASAVPYDLDESTLSEYRHLARRWHDWAAVRSSCARIANATFEYVCDADPPPDND